MKSMKKVFSMLLALVMILTIAMPAVEAQAVSSTKISSGSWVNVSKDKSYYKLTVKKEGYITVNTKFGTSSDYASGSAYIALLDSKLNKIGYSYVGINDNETVKYAVSPGTYYINVYSLYLRNASLKVKYDFTAVKQSNNYSYVNAVKLTAGKASLICQTQAVHYDRWFKITTKKSQKLTIDVASGASITVYDSDYNKISTSYESIRSDSFRGWRYVSSKVPKGTYYIKVSDSLYELWDSEIFDIKVK